MKERMQNPEWKSPWQFPVLSDGAELALAISLKDHKIGRISINQIPDSRRLLISLGEESAKYYHTIAGMPEFVALTMAFDQSGSISLVDFDKLFERFSLKFFKNKDIQNGIVNTYWTKRENKWRDNQMSTHGMQNLVDVLVETYIEDERSRYGYKDFHDPLPVQETKPKNRIQWVEKVPEPDPNRTLKARDIADLDPYGVRSN